MMKCIVQKSRNINAVWWNLSDCCLGNGILDHCQYTLLQNEFNCKTLHARKLSCNTEKYKEIQQKYWTGAYEIQRGTYTVAFQIGGPIPIRASTNVLGLRFQTPRAPPPCQALQSWSKWSVWAADIKVSFLKLISPNGSKALQALQYDQNDQFEMQTFSTTLKFIFQS